jgi:cytochrome P450
MNQDWTPPAPIPPKSGPGDWLRSLKTFRSQIEGLPERIFTQPAWRPPIPGTPFFVMAPELIEQVLLTQADSFTHGDLLPRMMRPAWGKGMFLAEGEAWRAQRQAAAPAFRAREIETLVHRFVAATEKMLERWLKQDGAEVERHGEMQRLTFEIIVDVLLSGGEGFDSDMMRRDVAGCSPK